MTEEMLQMAGLPAGLGENWHKRFNKRYPEIKAVNTRHVKVSRVKACNSALIRTWFEELERIKREFKINDSNIYNMDETDIQISNTEREKIFCSISSSSAVIKAPDLEK